MKERLNITIGREELNLMDGSIGIHGFQSRSQFIEEAVRFYSGYLSSTNNADFLSPVIRNVIRSEISKANANTDALLYSLAVQEGIMSDILTDVFAEDDMSLRDLEIDAVRRKGRVIKFLKDTKSEYVDMDKMLVEKIEGDEEDDEDE